MFQSLEEILEAKGGSFPFRVECAASKSARPLKLLVVGKRANGKFDSLISRKSASQRAGWSAHKKLWRAI